MQQLQSGAAIRVAAGTPPAAIAVAQPARRKPFPWHIVVFLAPAALIYTAVMIYPLAETLRLSFFDRTDAGVRFWVGLTNFERLFFDARWSEQFWNALSNNFYFFVIHMLVQNPIGVLLAALLSMTHLPGRAFFGHQLELGDPHMGATIAAAMFLIILVGVIAYLCGVHKRLRRHQF